jgi:hypothetical protein
MTESFTYFYSPSKNFDKIGKLWERFAETGVINCIVECVKEYAECVEAAQLQAPAGNEEQMDVDMINTQNVNPVLALQKKSYTAATLSNFFKILTYGSKYSLLIIGTIVNGGGIESFEKLLPRDDQQPGYTLDLASLLNQVLPQSEEVEHNRQQAFVFGPGQHYPPSQDPASQYQLIKKATQALEVQKKEIFNGLMTEFHIFCASKILPKLFLLYRTNISLQFRVKCLSIIDKILFVLPNEIVHDQIEALPLSQFVLQIFSNGRAQQVLLCLKVIMRVLKSNSMKFAVPFLREGVNEAVKEHTQVDRLFKYESEEPMPSEIPVQLCPCGRPGCTQPVPATGGGGGLFGGGFTSNYAKNLFSSQDEKARVTQKIEQLKAILDQDSVKIPEVKRAELNQILKHQVDSLKLIDEKESFESFMEAKMKKKVEASAEEKKDQAKKETTEAGKVEEPELKKEESEPPKITELIMKEATQL